jgi:hypothetical protein
MTAVEMAGRKELHVPRKNNLSPPEESPLPMAPADPLVLTLNAGGPSLGSHRVIDFAATAIASHDDATTAGCCEYRQSLGPARG